MKRIFKFLIAIFVFIALLSILTACLGKVDPDINDRPLTVSDITVEIENVKTEIIAGEELDLSALIVKTVMSDDSWTVLSEGATGYTVDLSEFNNQIHGIYTVYVTHGLFTKSFTVTVLPRLTGIEIAENSSQKTDFLWEEIFSANGLKINKVMSDGDKIELTADDYTIDYSAYASTNKNNTANSYTIKITLKSDKNIFTSYSVNVGARPAPVPQSITITAPVKTNYTIGESLNLSGGKVTVKHDWGEDTHIDLSSDLLSVSLADTAKESRDQIITVTHKATGFTATFKINVTKQIDSISIFSLPTKLNYTAGEAISLAGGVINVNFNDGSYDRANMNDTTYFSVSGYSCANSTFNKDGDGKEGYKTATVTLKGYTFSVNFDYYVPPKVKTLSWITAPSSTYFLGDPDYIETGVLKATYDDEAATSFTVDLNEDRLAGNPKLSIIGFSTLVENLEGSATITLKDWNLSLNLNYTVRDDKPVSIKLIREPDKKDYSGTATTPDLSGGEVEITFLSGEKETLALPSVLPHADFSASSIGISSPGETTQSQTVTVSYKNTVSISYDINFTVSCTGFTITIEPDKLSYKHKNENYSLAGGKIAISYDNGATENEIEMTSAAFTDNYTVEGWAENQNPGDYSFTITDKTDSDFFQTLDYKIIDHVTEFVISTLPSKLNYYKGDLADYSGASATVTYSFLGDTVYDDIAETDLFTITGFNTNLKGASTVTVTHNESEEQTNFSITILNRVKSITFASPITKTQYNKNELLDPAGGLLFVIYDFNLSSGSNAEYIYTDTEGLNNAGQIIGGGDPVLTGLRVTFPDFSTELSTDGTGRDATVEFGGATTTFIYFVKRLLTGLEWNVTPHKTAYVLGEAIDLSFASVYIVYDNTDKVRVNLDDDQKKTEASRVFTVSGFNSTEIGAFSYTVILKEDTSKTLSLDYTVASAIVNELELIYKPSTALLFGDEFNYSGVTFRRYFSDGTEDMVTLPANDKITAEGFDSTSLTNGTPRAITFTAVGTTVTNSEITYTISDWVSDFVVDNFPNKTVYYKDENVIDLTGGTYHLVWAGAGASAPFIMETGVIASMGLDTTAEKTAEEGALITLTYNTSTKTPLSATYNYVVKDKVASIELTTNPLKDVYYIGQEVNISGGAITITYDFNEPETINLPAEGFTAILDTSTSTLGKNRAMTITHTSSGFFCEFMVFVYTRTLNSLTIEKAPDKLTYFKDEVIDLTGGTIKLNYSAGEPDNLSMTESGVNIFSGNTAAVSESVAINLSYKGIVSSSFNIVVLRSLVSISVGETPKTVYKYGDTLDLTGGTITLLYDNAETETLSLTSEDVTITGFDSAAFGVQTLTVTYEGKTTAYEIEVKPFVISIEAATSETDFVYDTAFSYSSLIVSATYDYYPEGYSNTEVLTEGEGFYDYTIDYSAFVKDIAGDYIISVYWSYDNNVFTSFIVTVNQSEVISYLTLTDQMFTFTGYTDETTEHFLSRYDDVTFDIIYTDNRVETSSLSNATSDYELQNTTAAASADITFTYEFFTFTAQAQIIETAIVAISWNIEPTETVFYEGATEADVLSGGIINVTYNSGEFEIFDLVTEGAVAEGVTTNLASLIAGTDEETSAVTLIIYYEGLSLERPINYYVVE